MPPTPPQQLGLRRRRSLRRRPPSNHPPRWLPRRTRRPHRPATLQRVPAPLRRHRPEAEHRRLPHQLAHRESLHLKPTTIARYRDYITQDLIPALGAIPLDDLTRQQPSRNRPRTPPGGEPTSTGARRLSLPIAPAGDLPSGDLSSTPVSVTPTHRRSRSNPSRSPPPRLQAPLPLRGFVLSQRSAPASCTVRRSLAMRQNGSTPGGVAEQITGGTDS
ncbi:hypothetical protein ACFVVA_28075 [Kitasatospora sp. NPDC058048]|uniref:hypothetical protein n=1 Tax=Kitasatospora sp. NPDC058048 TaxID=3346313 RepID=UPI0036DF17C4